MNKRLHFIFAAIIFAAGLGQSLFASEVTRVPVEFSSGHETDPQDRGRPVVLIAAALGVKPEIFREAFSHVQPAGPDRGPTGEEARRNKEALMKALGKYGITNERLDKVSDYYRYMGRRGELWKNKPALVNALIKDGKIIGYEIVKGGSGYSSSPTISVSNHPEAMAKVELGFSTDLEFNGTISGITILPQRAK